MWDLKTHVPPGYCTYNNRLLRTRASADDVTTSVVVGSEFGGGDVTPYHCTDWYYCYYWHYRLRLIRDFRTGSLGRIPLALARAVCFLCRHPRTSYPRQRIQIQQAAR